MTDPNRSPGDPSPPDVMKDADIETALNEAASLVSEIVADAGDVQKPANVDEASHEVDQAERAGSTEAQASAGVDRLGELADQVVQQVDDAGTTDEEPPVDHDRKAQVGSPSVDQALAEPESGSAADAPADSEPTPAVAELEAATEHETHDQPHVSAYADSDLLAAPEGSGGEDAKLRGSPGVPAQAAPLAELGADSANAREEVPSARPRPPVSLHLAARFVGLLELLDRPLAGVGFRTRHLLGWIGITTLATSLLALLVLA